MAHRIAKVIFCDDHCTAQSLVSLPSKALDLRDSDGWWQNHIASQTCISKCLLGGVVFGGFDGIGGFDGSGGFFPPPMTQ